MHKHFLKGLLHFLNIKIKYYKNTPFTKILTMVGVPVVTKNNTESELSALTAV